MGGGQEATSYRIKRRPGLFDGNNWQEVTSTKVVLLRSWDTVNVFVGARLWASSFALCSLQSAPTLTTANLRDAGDST
jgi:hypothetical protein